MALTTQEIKDIVKTSGRTEKDTGSPEVQISLLSKRISDLTAHLKENPKDFGCHRGLIKLVGARRRFQRYYKAHSTPEQYRDLLTKLKLRK